MGRQCKSTKIRKISKQNRRIAILVLHKLGYELVRASLECHFHTGKYQDELLITKSNEALSIINVTLPTNQVYTEKQIHNFIRKQIVRVVSNDFLVL